MKLRSCRSAHQAFFVLWVLFSGAALAQQANPNALVTWTFRFSDSSGYDETTTSTCRGIPTCTGSYTTVVRETGCTNYLTFSGQSTISNIQIIGPAVTGNVAFTPGFYDIIVPSPPGICGLGQPTAAETFPFAMSYDAATGTGSGTLAGGSISFKIDQAAPPPVFPMTVRSQIDAVRANAAADIQFRPQDVGQNGRVFTFASAPVTRVLGAMAAKAVQLGSARVEPKADPVSCVLAQVSPSGQLIAVSAAQLAAYSTGVLSAAGTSVTILDNVSTPNVAGATFYVGYGASGQAMLDGGIFQNAVLVPGSSTCPPLPYMTSLWWNPNESGWGINFNQQGSILFGTLFTYDSSRVPMWLVMSAGAMQADGVTFAGDLYRTTGPAFNANPFTPIGPANLTRVGNMSVMFSQANAGTLTYTVNGVTVQKNIQRQVYGSRSANCLPTTASRTGSAQYQDLWWNANESGWGINIAHQDNTLFATLFTYDATGRDLWLVMSGGTRQADGSYLGDLYRTAGSSFSTNPFPPIGPSDLTRVGDMRLRFTNGESGTLTYSIGGVPVNKSITRQVFSSPLSACN